MCSRFLLRFLCALVFGALPFCVALPASAQSTVFADEFNSGSLSSNWSVYGSDRWLSRTQFGNKPSFATEGATKYMRLRLDTYNLGYPGSMLVGTEMHSKTQFALGGGLQIEARVRAPNLPPGIVWAFFMLGERGVWPYSYARDEIDFENLTTLGNGQVWTNIFNDTNPNTGTGADSGMVSSAPGADAGKWMIYKIRWFSDRVEWWLNIGSGSDILVRTETNPALVCDDTQSVRFNIWASDSSWVEAYGNLPVTADKTKNTSYYFDVDYMRMTSIGQRGTVGTGDGLKAEYFDNADFTAPVKTRVDPKINFDWGYGAPLDGMGRESFSVRWSGQVQASLTENYTFYARADDGVRLWVNNKLVIDQWKPQAVTEYSTTVALKAGQKYAIKMEYFDADYDASAQLRWSSPSTTKSIIPKSQLYSLYTPPTDSTKPVVNISSPAANSTSPPLSQVSGTASDNVGVIYVTARLYRYSDKTYWTGYTWGPYATEVATSATNNWQNWTLSFPSLTTGKYSLRAAARDTAGNIGYSAVNEFNIATTGDVTAPTAAISTPAHTWSYNSLSQVTGTAADAVGVTSVRVRLSRLISGATTYWNGSAWTSTDTDLPASGTTNWTWALPTLTDGQYSLRATARDTAGNAGYSSVIEFYIDNTPPVVSISAPIQSQNYSVLAKASGTAGDAVGVAEARVRLRRSSDGLYWNGSVWSATATDLLASGTTDWTFALPSLSPGEYSLRATARDWIGNVGVSSDTKFVMSSNAVTTISIIEPKQDGGYSSLPSANGVASNSNGLADVRCVLRRGFDGRYWDGNTWVDARTEVLANGTNTWVFTMPMLPSAYYTFWAVARDQSGNATSTDGVNFYVP